MRRREERAARWRLGERRRLAVQIQACAAAACCFRAAQRRRPSAQLCEPSSGAPQLSHNVTTPGRGRDVEEAAQRPRGRRKGREGAGERGPAVRAASGPEPGQIWGACGLLGGWLRCSGCCWPEVPVWGRVLVAPAGARGGCCPDGARQRGACGGGLDLASVQAASGCNVKMPLLLGLDLGLRGQRCVAWFCGGWTSMCAELQQRASVM